MSMKHIRWAFEQEGLKPAEKLVLLCLAHHAGDKSAQAWPKKSVIIKATGLSSATVKRALNVLKSAGLIEDTGLRKGQTGQTVIYRMAFQNIGDEAPSKGLTMNPLKGLTVSRLGGDKGLTVSRKGAHCEPQRGSQRASSINRTQYGTQYGRNNIVFEEKNSAEKNSAEFEKFWSQYPHPRNRGSKKVAKAKFLKLKNLDEVFLGLTNYAKYCKTQSWYSPAMAQTWINQERWTEFQKSTISQANGHSLTTPEGKQRLLDFMAERQKRYGFKI